MPSIIRRLDHIRNIVPTTHETFSTDLGTYTGITDNGYRHGSGKMLYDNGNQYKGRWSIGKRHGRGRMDYANGDIYSGG